MGNLTVVLDDVLEERLRKAVSRRDGAKKGGISELVNEALSHHLDELERPSGEPPQLFKALVRREVVCEAGSLGELAQALKERGVEPRNVRIVSTKPLKPLVRGGLRGVRA